MLCSFFLDRATNDLELWLHELELWRRVKLDLGGQSFYSVRKKHGYSLPEFVVRNTAVSPQRFRCVKKTSPQPVLEIWLQLDDGKIKLTALPKHILDEGKI